MKSIGAFAAKTHLPKLLDRVAKGEAIQITKRGTPVAKLVPPDAVRNADKKAIMEEIRRARKGRRLGKVSLRQLIDEGRKY